MIREEMEQGRKKANRNKTIDFSLEEGRKYLDSCLYISKEKPEPITCEMLKNQLVVGDTFEVMPKLPEAFVDLLIVDPPYNLRKDYHGNCFNEKKAEEYRQYTEQWVKAVIPLLKPTATVYVCCDWKSSMIIGDVLQKHFRLRNRITWQREKGRGAKENWKNGMEDIWYVTMSDEFIFNLDAVKQRRRVIAPYRQDGEPKDWTEVADGSRYRDTCPSNFWDDISIPYWSMPENTAHPTQKPEKLMAKLILASSRPGDVVLDPFAGAGTTAVTAKKLNRIYVGIEQNELYCAWAQKRLELAEEDNSIQGYADGVFWERNTAALQKRKNKNKDK